MVAYVRKGCKTSKRVTDYLEGKGVSFKRVDLVENPRSKEELKALINKLGLSPREMLRPRDRTYRELGLRTRELPDDVLLDLMVKHPELIKRPILVRENKTAIVAQPGDVEDFLS